MDDRLYRSRNDRIFAGVAGGLADRWDADPSLIRLVWALLVVFTGGIALLVYVIMALVVPDEPVGYMPPGVAPVPGGAAVPSQPAQSYATTASYWAAPTRAERRAMRREARRARRGNRDGQALAAIGGAFLILLGSLFLLREVFPGLDFDWFWPMILIAIGVAVVVGTLTRRSDVAGAEPASPWQAAATAAPASPDAPPADARESRPV